MPTIPIFVNGGLVTSKDASLLAQGELTVANDAEYRPNDPGIWKMGGRSALMSSAEASSIYGGVLLPFESSALYVLGVGTTLRQASATAITGMSFSNLVTGLTGGTSLDAVHWNSKYYLLNGVDRNREVASDGTVVIHGMLDNTVSPSVGSTGSGTGFTLTSGATVVYWVEERVKSGTTVLKRSGETGSYTVTLTGTGALVKPVVTRPAVVNSDATHWALFGTATNVTFPTGFEIGEVAIATATIEDTRTGTDPAAPSGSAYEVVSVDIAGTTQNVAKHGQAPISSTGDLFEDCLCLDDSTDHSLIKFSFYNEPHAVPAINVIKMATKERDYVTLIRRLGQILIVGMKESLWHVNSLPQAEDAAFQPGRMSDQIEGAHGVVGPMAADLFSFGQGVRLAYVSTYGVHVTDGYTWDDLMDDIDFASLVNISRLPYSILRNNPAKYRLEFYFTPSGGTANTRVMYLHYHPSHAKTGIGGGFRAKITGPNQCEASAAFGGRISNVFYQFTAASDFKVYVEGQGNTDASPAGGIDFSVRTGDKYFPGQGGMSRITSIGAHHNAAAGQTGTLRLIRRVEGKVDVDTSAVIVLDRRETTSSGREANGENYQFGIENSDSSGAVRVDYFAASYDDFGGTTY